MDIDCFKQANDCHGHLYGDKILVALARNLESVTAGVVASHCASLSGDEFALLLQGVSLEVASTLAENLRALLNGHAFEMENGRVSLCIGVASLSAARELPLEMLISHADKALYRAKLLGRDCIEVQSVFELVPLGTIGDVNRVRNISNGQTLALCEGFRVAQGANILASIHRPYSSMNS